LTDPVQWLLLPVEVKARGLEGRLLLGAHAASRGWKVVVGKKSQLNSRVRDLPRGLYFDKSIQSLALWQMRYIRALGNTYAAIDEEGLVHEGGAAAYVKRRFTAETLAETSAFCCWGEAQAEVVRADQPALADRVVVTGNPRVDLWRPEMHELHRERIDEIRADVGRFVLVPSNFANVIGADGPERTRRFGEVTGHYADPAERERFARYLDLRAGVLDRLGPALVTLARSLPDGHSVVVRPHPSEDHAHWEKLGVDEPRLVVRFEGPLTPWLLAADCVVHSNCTSGVEAAVAGVPAIAYAPLDESEFPMLPNQVSQVVDSDEGLVRAVDAALSGRPVMPESARATVDHHLAAVRGPSAAERMVDLFETLPVRDDRGDGRLGHRRTDGLRTAPGRARAWLDRRRRHGPPAELPTASATLASQKFPPTPLSEVADFVARLGAVDPRLAGVRATELAPSLFRLEATGA
jgi:surface carbohydrate biosynthesis protein